MTTMTLKNHATKRLSPPDPLVPAYMEAAGIAGILVRHTNDLAYSPRIIETSGFSTCAEPATPADMCRYIEARDNITFDDDLDLIEAMPAPIDIHDQEIWMDCNEEDEDYLAFREVYNSHLFADDDGSYASFAA